MWSTSRKLNQTFESQTKPLLPENDTLRDNDDALVRVRHFVPQECSDQQVQLSQISTNHTVADQNGVGGECA
jgi:hypothetical protein